MKKCLCLTALVLVLVGLFAACGNDRGAEATPSPAVTNQPAETPTQTTAPGSVTEEDSRVEPERGDNSGDVSGNNGVDSGHDSARPNTAEEKTDRDSAKEDSAGDDLKRAGEDLGDAVGSVGDAVGDAARDMTR